MKAAAARFPNRRDWWWLAGGLGVLFVWFLGARGLNEPDEGRYANIAMTMAKSGGDWWEPRMSGYGHYDKPPLIYWATAASFRAFGHHEWAARLPSLAGACLALAGLGWTAYRLHGARVAWLAVLIAGTSVQFWTFGRILSPDMLLTGWCTLGVAAWAEGREKAEGGARKGLPTEDTEEEGRKAGTAWGWWSVSLLCWVLAWWTKATPALIPLLGLTAGVLVTQDKAGWRALRPFLLLPAILCLGSPWYLSMLGRYPDLRGFFFGRELVGRLAGRVDGRHGPLWYYVPVTLAAALPWWPVAAWKSWQRRGAWAAATCRDRAAAWTRRLGVEGWIVVVGLVILSLAASKLPGYTLTLAPWAALLIARTLVSASDLPVTVAGAAGDQAGQRGRPPALLLAPAGIFAVVILVGAALVPDRYESKMGVNSSLREASRFLKAHGATRVDADHYWPGLEFYLGEETVHYLVNAEGPGEGEPAAGKSGGRRVERHQERASDPGLAPERFVDSDGWPALPPGQRRAEAARPGGWWFVRFHRRGKPRFDTLLKAEDPGKRPLKVRRFGDFDLYRMPDDL